MTADPQLISLLLALAAGYGSLRSRMKAVEKQADKHTEHLAKLYAEIRKLTTH